MRVFVSAMGQHDNLGDTALRRAFLDTLRPYGPLTVFVGTRSAGYLSGLGVTDGDTVVRTSKEWRRALLAGARSGMLYAHNAGEIELEFTYALRYLRLAPILIANRLRGGVNLHVGLGVRTPTRWRRIVRAVLKTMHMVAWRDEWSLRYMGLGQLTPDWALTAGSDEESLRQAVDRPLLAVSLRHNGEGITPALTETVRGAAMRLSLRPIVVAQIRRDEPLAREFAELIGGETLSWNSDDMRTQEDRIREVYRHSSAVISDRLHALVFGVTEGAMPVSLSTDERDKATRTLRAAGIPITSIDRHSAAPRAISDALADADSRRVELFKALAHSRSAVDETRNRIAQIFARKA